MKDFVLKGDIVYSTDQKTLICVEDGYAVCVDGKSRGVFSRLPAEYEGMETLDYTGKLIMPGMVDLHIHAPQYAFRGLGMDLELLDWLATYTFPEEEKYKELAYAEKAYGIFVREMRNSATTRAVIFATVHRESTILLMDMLEKAGLDTYVGKVNMDRDAPDGLRELSASMSAYDTFGWINKVNGRYEHTRPILTPRFLPSCSDELLSELHEVQKAYGLPVQSHLSENPGEVELVKKLFPKAAFYGDGYDKYGLFGGDVPTIMAHCIYSTPEEIELMRDRGVFVAHCPASNMNLSSGIAPIRKYLELGMNVGLGSDVAGGESESIFRSISDAIQVSKLYWRMVDNAKKPLTFEEGFYLATLGGGKFFGKVGSFMEGYEFDAVIIDDSALSIKNDLDIRSRLERAVYLEADDDYILDKYVSGRKIEIENKM